VVCVGSPTAGARYSFDAGEDPGDSLLAFAESADLRSADTNRPK
jgi:hypothetical protein